MVGLVQFLPTALLVFVAGHAVDRYERKRVVQICLIVEATTALLLAWGAYAGSLTVPEIFVAMACWEPPGRSKVRRPRRCCRWWPRQARCSAPPRYRAASASSRPSPARRLAAWPMPLRPPCP